jgi:DNA-binding transcriptional ArsR family regulator
MDELEDKDGLSKAGEPIQGLERVDKGNKVRILPVNGDSRKITQILSNETSLKILELLGKKGMSATNIAEELHLPLTTVKYNLDSLVESDLIKVKQIKWSKKGRQVKIYESVEKLIVLVPSRNSIDTLSIINMLQKYIGVIGAALFAAAGIEYFSAYMQAKKIFDATTPIRMGIVNSTEPVLGEKIAAVDENNAMSQQIPENATINSSPGIDAGPTENLADVPVSTPDGSGGPYGLPPLSSEGLSQVGGIHGLYDTLSLHPGVWFLFGCLFIVSLLIVREVYYKKKAK